MFPVYLLEHPGLSRSLATCQGTSLARKNASSMSARRRGNAAHPHHRGRINFRAAARSKRRAKSAPSPPGQSRRGARSPTERVRSSSVPRHPSDTADARCTVCVTDGDIRRRRRRRQRRAKNVPVSRAPMRPVFHVSPPSPSGNIVRQTPDTITYHCHRRRRCRADNDDDGSIVEQHRTQR